MSPAASRRPPLLLGARAVALVIVTIMTVYFLVTDAVRSDNPFLVPDLVLSATLLVSALLPQRLAPVALIFSFGWAAGVYTTSMCTHIINGRFPVDHVFLLIFCVGVPLLLARDLVRPRVAGASEPADRPSTVAESAVLA
ncbi:hypothetical protein [Cryptosporangium aurantiacum]|uniref:Uncharacterized protein n=1 Tax=Cryptosporangium aurantiacum TaxID=134849 RepID=A0A1M7RLY3_9ACTN|nr:hypothetical protein [Cryptosporangium aurantiacum]SHN47199.1 hypothetical protein SAMN05443668_12147 [Cryptosporangium aurantiacum]